MNTKNLIKGILLSMSLFMIVSVNAQTYQLVWSDEFNGKGKPDPSKWDYEDGYIRNDELQYYTRNKENARQKDGNLEIVVRKANKPVKGNKHGKQVTFDYTSGSIITLGKADWKYGKIEGRFKLPGGQGLWACFWTLGSNMSEIGWPKCGEIDIFEHINSENLIYGTAHWADDNNKHASKGDNTTELDVTQWHTYSIEWTSTSIKWLVDGVKFHELNILDGVNSTQEFHMPHYILINLPIGGSWPGSPDPTTKLPATMYCDYVRVYELIADKK